MQEDKRWTALLAKERRLADHEWELYKKLGQAKAGANQNWKRKFVLQNSNLQSWNANRNSIQIIRVCLLWISVLPSLLQKALGKSSKKFWIICLLLMRVRQLSSRKLKLI